MDVKSVETKVGQHSMRIETGRVAKQADGAVVVWYADTVVLVTAVASKGPVQSDFFPLRTDYREMTYAAGKFPGGFYKREGRPTIKEILTSRLMDRPIRPLFPDGYMNELQVVSQVLSADRVNDPDVLAMVGASACLVLAENIPFLGPVGAVRVGRVNGELIINPTVEQRVAGDIDIVVSGTETEIVMIEGSAKEVSEQEIIDAIALGHKAVAGIAQLQKELAGICGKKWQPDVKPAEPHPLYATLLKDYYSRVQAANIISGKMNRKKALDTIREEILAKYCAPDTQPQVTTGAMNNLFMEMEHKAVREQIASTGRRSDGRGLTDIRPITCDVGILPRVHGSALFTRGETQALVTCTLGTVTDEQRVDGLGEEYTKKFMLDYNFPPFCVGESRMMRGPGRREIGHGDLAERSLARVMPTEDVFPYTVRIVSDILESNGSSSMASVCGATLAMMDAGVQIVRPVAGIAMGMVKEGDKACILSDILGEEDHCGDMDLKVAGTQNGVTGIQMDLKLGGISHEILVRSFEQAREGRLAILQKMLSAIAQPRAEISRLAPKLVRIKIPPDKIGALIGPGGKNVRKLQEDTKSTIEIEDDGTVTISSESTETTDKARAIIESMFAEPEIGRTYEGPVSTVKDFGCFVEFMPGRDGLVHISELSDTYVKDISSICKVGDIMLVKVIDIDDQGRVRLSRKAALKGKSDSQKDKGKQ
jgi:polyribonucleotide nucleotidyltransferase